MQRSGRMQLLNTSLGIGWKKGLVTSSVYVRNLMDRLSTLLMTVAVVVPILGKHRTYSALPQVDDVSCLVPPSEKSESLTHKSLSSQKRMLHACSTALKLKKKKKLPIHLSLAFLTVASLQKNHSVELTKWKRMKTT